MKTKSTPWEDESVDAEIELVGAGYEQCLVYPARTKRSNIHSKPALNPVTTLIHFNCYPILPTTHHASRSLQPAPERDHAYIA